MDALPLLVFIWVVGFAITGGMIFEMVDTHGMPHRLGAWAIFVLILFLVWPIALGSIIISIWTKEKK